MARSLVRSVSWCGGYRVGESVLKLLRSAEGGSVSVEEVVGVFNEVVGGCVSGRVGDRELVHGEGEMLYAGVHPWPLKHVDLLAAGVVKPSGLAILGVSKRDGRVTAVAVNSAAKLAEGDVRLLKEAISKLEEVLRAKNPEKIPTSIIQWLRDRGIYVGACGDYGCLLMKPAENGMEVILVDWGNPRTWITRIYPAAKIEEAKMFMYSVLTSNDALAETISELRSLTAGTKTTARH